jgi:hypothetical protein
MTGSVRSNAPAPSPSCSGPSALRLYESARRAASHHAARIPQLDTPSTVRDRLLCPGVWNSMA